MPKPDEHVQVVMFANYFERCSVVEAERAVAQRTPISEEELRRRILAAVREQLELAFEEKYSDAEFQALADNPLWFELIRRGAELGTNRKAREGKKWEDFVAHIGGV